MIESCMGRECPIKNQCAHYTKGAGKVIRKCTNQKKFVQDKEKVNTDCL